MEIHSELSQTTPQTSPATPEWNLAGPVTFQNRAVLPPLDFSQLTTVTPVSFIFCAMLPPLDFFQLVTVIVILVLEIGQFEVGDFLRRNFHEKSKFSLDFQWKIQKIEIFEKIEKSKKDFSLKIFEKSEKSIFRFSPKISIFWFFHWKSNEILIFRENSGAKNLQLQIDLSPKLRWQFIWILVSKLVYLWTCSGLIFRGFGAFPQHTRSQPVPDPLTVVSSSNKSNEFGALDGI